MAPDRTLADRYELVSHIARGGMADVYEARDALLGRRVAVKVLHSQFSSDEAFVKRFRREAQAAANLSHPNIVSIYDWGEDGDTYFIVMELIEGNTLRDVLKSDQRLLPRRSCEIASEVASALAVAHRAGLIHRDIKPGNILLSPDGTVKVTDFGIARAWDDSQELTKTGAVIGTATYFSPEQAQGIVADERSDVYSLGVVLYEMLAGVPPFTGESPVAVAYQHVSEPVPPPALLNDDVGQGLEGIVMKALQKTPEDRYQSANEIRTDLLRFLQGETPIAVPTGDAPTEMMTVTTMTPPTVPPDETYRYLAPERSPSQIPFILTAFALLVALGVGLFLVFRLFNNTPTGPIDVLLPDVSGMTQNAAIGTLQDLNLKVSLDDPESHPTVPAGQVIGSQPSAGEKITEGQTVTIRISAGQEGSNVPLVVGESSEEAQRLVALNGLAVGEVIPQTSEVYGAGTVVAQDPPAGTKLPPNSPVILYVSTGPSTVTVKDLYGRPINEVSFLLEGDGLVVIPENEFSSDVAQGFVIRTEPGPDTEIPTGSEITVFVSQGPQPVAVPSLVGFTPAQAQETLAAVGLGYRQSANTVTVDPSLDGLVAQMSEVPGNLVPPGHVVTVVLGVGSAPPDTTPPPTP